MKINWNYPTSVWVGENRIKDLAEACKNLNISSPLFVTDKDLINLNMTKKHLVKTPHLLYNGRYAMVGKKISFTDRFTRRNGQVEE